MENLQLIKEYHLLIWEAKDLNAIDRFFNRDVIIHSPVETTQGTEKMKSIISAWYKGFPNLKVFWDDFICEENKVVSRWHAQGQHEGEFLGHPASQNDINYSGVTIY